MIPDTEIDAAPAERIEPKGEAEVED